MKRARFTDDSLDETAGLGLEIMKEFLKSSRGIGSEAWARLRDQAKVGCVAVATKVRREAAHNNAKALELMAGRGRRAMEELPGGGS